MLQRKTNHIVTKLLGDLLITYGVVFIAFYFRGTLPYGLDYIPTQSDLIFLFSAATFYPTVYFLFSLYDPERSFRAIDEYQILTISSFVAALALAGAALFVQRSISRLLLVYFYVLQFVFVCIWQAIFRFLLKNKKAPITSTHRVLLIGGGDAAQRVIDTLRALSLGDLQLVGYLTDGAPIPSANGSIPLLGKVSDVSGLIRPLQVDDVLIAMPSESYREIDRLMTTLINQPCNVWVVPDYFNMMLHGSKVDELGGVPLISLKVNTISGYQRVIKRLFDIIVGGIILILAFPLITFIALLVKLYSRGPVFFKQVRIGENERPFEMYKFRSMVSNAEQRQNEVIRHDGKGNLIHKTKDDPRVTRVGRFIRRTSLDELPQLFNVLKGDMSLVGPRPELPLLVERYEPWQRQRFAVPQGMTGWWQVNGRSDKPMHLHTEDDLFYVQHYSLILDLQIIVKTVWIVLRGKGAY